MTTRQKVRLSAISFILAYAIVRFFFVKATLEGYGVNSWVFLVIDIVSGIVYVVGLEHLILALVNKAKYAISWPRLVLWSLITTACFAAPYLYIYASGQALPVSLSLGIGVIVCLLLINALIGLRKRIRENKHK